MVYDIKTFFGIWFTQCCHVVFVNQESWTSTCGGEGAKVVVVKQKNWKCPGRKAVWEKKRKRKPRKQATVWDYTGRLSWRFGLGHGQETGKTGSLGLLAELRQGEAAQMKEPRDQ